MYWRSLMHQIDSLSLVNLGLRYCYSVPFACFSSSALCILKNESVLIYLWQHRCGNWRGRIRKERSAVANSNMNCASCATAVCFVWIVKGITLMHKDTNKVLQVITDIHVVKYWITSVHTGCWWVCPAVSDRLNASFGHFITISFNF